MKQLDLFYDKLPRYIITKQKGSNKLWVIWDDWELKETNYVFISGQKAIKTNAKKRDKFYRSPNR